MVLIDSEVLALKFCCFLAELNSPQVFQIAIKNTCRKDASLETHRSKQSYIELEILV